MPFRGANMKMKTTKFRSIRFVTHAALIATLYIALTFLAFWLGLDKGVIQVRFSEALCVLTAFTPAAVPGLAVGCLLANLLTGAHILDVIFGSLATFLGACGGFLFRSLAERKYLGFAVTLPTVLFNTAIIPLLLAFVYGAKEAYIFLLLSVCAGELISATLLGTVLLLALKPYAKRLFGDF